MLVVRQAYKRAEDVLESNHDALIRVAEALLEYEVLDGEEVAALVKGEDMAELAARKRAARTQEPEQAAGPSEPKKQDVSGPAIAPDPLKQPS